MADDILNINGKLIRLKDNGDGTWSWATSLTGSNAPKSGQKTLASAATAEALGPNQEYKEITIIAKSTNTGQIYVGDATVTSSSGAILPPGGYVTLDFVNTGEVYVIASVGGDGVSWIGVV